MFYTKIKNQDKKKINNKQYKKKYLAINNLCSCRLLGNKVTGVTQKMKIGAVCVMTYCLLLFMLFKSEIAKFGSVLLVYYALVILIVIFAFFLSIYNNLPKTNQLTKETNKQATNQTNKLTRRGHQLIEAIIMIKISCTIISTSWSRLRCVLSCPQHTLISVTTLTVFSKNDTTIEVNPTKEKSREKTISLPFELMLKKHQEPGACMW